MEERNLVDIVDLFLVGCLSFLIVLQQGCNPLPLETTMDEVELQFLETDFGDGDNLSNLRYLALVMVDGNQKDLLYVCNLHSPGYDYCVPIFLWLFLDCMACQRTPQSQCPLIGETITAQIQMETIAD